MSLLKWKEMAQKRSELGEKINAVRETIKQKTISDQMGQVEATKLFEPITSGLGDLTVPKAPLRRLKKKDLFQIMVLKQEMMRKSLIMV